MSVCAMDLLGQAKSLENSSSEVELRTGVNRAYYAAYHSANDWHNNLATGGLPGNMGSGVHQRLINCLTNPTVAGATGTQSKSIGYMLLALKRSRFQADYVLAATVTEIDATNAVAQAEMLLKKAV